MRATVLLFSFIAAPAFAANLQQISLDTAAVIQSGDVKAESAEFKGKRCLKITWQGTGPGAIAPLKGVEFKDGTIELEVAGTVGAGAGEAARGFIGIAFRVQGQPVKYEYIYLRPTNGRADDQVRRNHSTQYSSHPDYPWSRLRKESPEKYESYVDLEPGGWTRMKVVVQGAKARLYVHGAEQPCLVVNDLKLGDGKGGLALWVGPGTVGYFTNLRVTE